MRNFIFFIAILLSIKNLAQSPPGIPYQAIARTTTGEPYANGALQARFSLHEQTATGTVSYAETHSLQTDAFGLFSTTFGAGTPITGTFAAINWGLTTKFLQVEIDLGNGWIDMGTQQLMSVPYAMYAGSAGNQFTNNSGFNTISNAVFYGSLVQSANFCANLEESGQTDWRLPSMDEVFNYIEVNGIANGQSQLWTTTIQSSGFILFEEGPYVTMANPKISEYSRCVR